MLITIALFSMLVLAGCAPGAAVPSAPAAGEPSGGGTGAAPERVPTELPPTPSGKGIEPPAAALAARQALAGQLGAAEDEIEILAAEQVQWPNACLGAAEPDEMCADVITPGWRVVLEAAGQVYEYHTNQDGSQVRAFGRPSAGSGQAELPAAAIAAQYALSKQLKVSILAVQVVSVEETEWPDSCLGAAKPDEMCAQVVTPGYKVILEHRGQRYEYHTNADGSQLAEAQAAQPAGAEVVLAWRREGGIAGFCDDLKIYAGGRAEAVSCKRGGGALPVEIRLTSGQIAQLSAWAGRFASFELKQQDPPGAADAMIIQTAFVGSGSEQPSAAQQEEIALFAQEIYSSAAR